MAARRWLSADLAITLALLILAVWVLLQARTWPLRASLFPLVIGGVVLGIAVLKLVLDLATARRAPIAARPQGLVEEEEAAEAELEDVFATAPRSLWLSALAWMALFFLLLWALGAFIAVPLFAFAYLLAVSRESLLLAGTYAAVAWVFVFGLFDRLLHVPLPGGAVLGALGL